MNSRTMLASSELTHDAAERRRTQSLTCCGMMNGWVAVE